MWWLNHLVNPLVRAVLRSPLHALLSGRLVLLRVTGRRSGRIFTFPVAYAWAGNELVVTVGAPDRKRWWRNIGEATPIGVVLCGRRRSGVARLVRGSDAIHVRITLDARG